MALAVVFAFAAAEVELEKEWVEKEVKSLLVVVKTGLFP